MDITYTKTHSRIRLPAAWRWSLAVWASARIALSAWGFLIWRMGIIPPNAGQEFYFDVNPIVNGWKGALLGVWQRWDAIYYMRIAEQGYTASDLTTFFPLFPVLGRLASFITFGEVLFGLLVVSNTALILAYVLLYKIVEEEYSTQLARITLVCLTLFPTAFFLFTPYPQSLSLLLVLSAYYAARNAHWGWASAAGLAAGLTHSTVLPLALVLAWEVWKSWKKSGLPGRWLAAFAPISPAAGVGLFLAWRMWAGFPSYSWVQAEMWGRIVQAPWHTAADFIRLAAARELPNSSWVNLAFVILIAAVSLWVARRITPSHLIYQSSTFAYLLLFSTIREPLASWGRFCLLMFPLFIGLAMWFQPPKRRMVGLALGLGLQLFLSGVFILWGWVS